MLDEDKAREQEEVQEEKRAREDNKVRMKEAKAKWKNAWQYREAVEGNEGAGSRAAEADYAFTTTSPPESVSAGTASSSLKQRLQMSKMMKSAGVSKSLSTGSTGSVKKTATEMPGKKNTTSSEDKKKSKRAASRVASLETFMDSISSFRSNEAGHKKEITETMGVNDFSEASVNILMSHYKVQDQDVLCNTALAM